MQLLLCALLLLKNVNVVDIDSGAIVAGRSVVVSEGYIKEIGAQETVRAHGRCSRHRRERPLSDAGALGHAHASDGAGSAVDARLRAPARISAQKKCAASAGH